MDKNRFTKKILKYISVLKATTMWVEVIKGDAVESVLKADLVYNIKEFRR